MGKLTLTGVGSDRNRTIHLSSDVNYVYIGIDTPHGNAPMTELQPEKIRQIIDFLSPFSIRERRIKDRRQN